MLRYVKYLAIIFFSYFLLQGIISVIFNKEHTTETVLVKITDKKVGNIDVGWGDARTSKKGWTSSYKYVYNLEVIRRDGWIGNIQYVYSDIDLEKNKVYGLELKCIETTSNFQYWLVPTIWSDYAFHILTVYNFRKEMSNIDFSKNNYDYLFDKMINTFDMFNRTSDPLWSDEGYSQE
jgi:hypothetical protein